jgi:hypothetical protein
LCERGIAVIKGKERAGVERKRRGLHLRVVTPPRPKRGKRGRECLLVRYWLELALRIGLGELTKISLPHIELPRRP